MADLVQHPIRWSELQRQRRSNQNSLQYAGEFAGHRRQLTELLVRESAGRGESSAGRLCVLGAGNCLDLDLERLARSYAAIHLVDVDEYALARARERQSESIRARLILHGGSDLSGLLARLERWQRMELTPDELLSHPERTAAQLAVELGGPFEVVASTCVLTQMQLALRRALSETHPCFEAAAFTLTLTHLRTLAGLTRPGGRCLLVTDLATEQMAPLRSAESGGDLRDLLADLLRAGDVFNVVHPQLIADLVADDPSLREQLALLGLADPWLWHNGPQRIFLVCALAFERRALAPRSALPSPARSP